MQRRYVLLSLLTSLLDFGCVCEDQELPQEVMSLELEQGLHLVAVLVPLHPQRSEVLCSDALLLSLWARLPEAVLYSKQTRLEPQSFSFLV